VVATPSASRRIAERTRREYGTAVKSTMRAFKRGGAPDISASATSIPSAEVPDIKPSTRIGRFPEAWPRALFM
jgi:hypothetical protein